MKETKKITYLGLLTGIALVLAYVEVLLPPLINSIPGIKIGLPNIAIIFVLYRFGVKYAAATSLVRIIIVSLLFGNPISAIYSLSGGFLSLLAMSLMKRIPIFSAVSVSVAGGVLHNVGQILAAMAILGTKELGYYMIVLAISGTVAGIFVGIAASIAIKKVPVK